MIIPKLKLIISTLILTIPISTNNPNSNPSPYTDISSEDYEAALQIYEIYNADFNLERFF